MAGTKEIARKNGKKGGRPKGSTTKPQLKDYLTKQDIQKIILTAKKKAKEGDTNMLKFILEQIFGRAPQSIELPGGEGEILIKWKR